LSGSAFNKPFVSFLINRIANPNLSLDLGIRSLFNDNVVEVPLVSQPFQIAVRGSSGVFSVNTSTLPYDWSVVLASGSSPQSLLGTPGTDLVLTLDATQTTVVGGLGSDAVVLGRGLTVIQVGAGDSPAPLSMTLSTGTQVNASGFDVVSGLGTFSNGTLANAKFKFPAGTQLQSLAGAYDPYGQVFVVGGTAVDTQLQLEASLLIASHNEANSQREAIILIGWQGTLTQQGEFWVPGPSGG